jgi:hypothetical protein
MIDLARLIKGREDRVSQIGSDSRALIVKGHGAEFIELVDLDIECPARLHRLGAVDE